MKKILSILTSLSLSVTSVTTVVSCDIGDRDGSTYLSELPDYKWDTDFYGDRMEAENQIISGDIKYYEELKNSGELNKIRADNFGSYIDYSKFNTGYQWTEAIKKQAVTGVPTNRIFMPTGNFISDFGVTSKAQKYKVINGVLDWDPSIDMDAKYNKSSVSLRETMPVAIKNIDTQDDKIKSNILQFTSYAHRSATNTNVGIKNPMDNNFNQWSNVDNFVDWGGSSFEGLVKIPGSDVIEAAHKNGTKVFGTIFLDGYHGLTKSMMKNLFKKDNDGTYLFAKKIIELIGYYGFDGFYWNNEPNGSLPNGTILDYKEVYELIKQVKEIRSESNEKNIKEMEIIFYNNGSQLGAHENSNIHHNIEGEKMSEITDYISDNFGSTANTLVNFENKHKRWQGDNKYKILTMASLASNSLNGFYDTRNLTNYHYDENGAKYGNSQSDKLKEEQDRVDGKWTFKNNEKPYASFSFYEDNGGGSYGEDARSIAMSSNEFKNGNITDAQLSLYEQQVSSLFDEMIYNGRNRFVKGSSEKNDLSDNSRDHGFYFSFPVGISRKDVINSYDLLTINHSNNKKYEGQKETILNAKDKDNNYIYSFGAANLRQERTVVIDQNPYLKTNFSNGNGIKFVTNEGIEIENYPWTNKKMVDVQPTYKNDLYYYNSNLKDLKHVNHGEVSGWYDFYNPYKKGNSFALGQFLNIDGSITPYSFKKDDEFLWNVMGTNLSRNDLRIESKLSLPPKENIADYFDLKYCLTLDNGNRVELNSDLTEDMRDGWYTLSSDLSKINISGKIAKIGIVLKVKKDIDTLLDLGEFTIDSNFINKNIKKFELKDFNVEYLIEREKEKYLRINWKTKGENKPDWYEILTMDKKGNIFRAGETIDDLYFVRKIRGEDLIIGIKPVFNGEDNEKVYWYEVKK